MVGKCYYLCLVALFVGVQTVSAYPSRYDEEAVDTYHNLFSQSNDERSYQGSVDNDDDMADTDEISDLERELIARLLDERDEFDADKEEPMNDDYKDHGERGMSDLDAPRPKYNFDEPSLSDFEAQYRQMLNDFSNKDTQFDRGYTPEDMVHVNEFGEIIMPDFENKEYGRNVNEELGDNLFSDYNRNGDIDETGLSDFGQEGDERDLKRLDDLNGNNDFIEDNDFNGEYLRSDDFEGETFSDMNDDLYPPKDFDSEYKRNENVDENQWPADFDEDFLNADNRFLNDNFKEDTDFSRNNLRAYDINNDDTGDTEQEGEYERMAGEETNFDNGDITREQDKFDTREGYGIDGSDGDSEDGELNDEDLEILRRLVQNILEKKSENTGDLDE